MPLPPVRDASGVNPKVKGGGYDPVKLDGFVKKSRKILQYTTVCGLLKPGMPVKKTADFFYDAVTTGQGLI